MYKVGRLITLSLQSVDHAYIAHGLERAAAHYAEVISLSVLCRRPKGYLKRMFSVRRAIRFPSPIAASDSVFMYLRAVPLTALRNMALRLPSRGFTHSCAGSRLRYGLLRSSIGLMTEYALRRVFNVTPARHALFGAAHASARWASINEAFTC